METLANLAATRPAASRVFHRHRLDFCCGGGRPLDEVCGERGLDPNALLQEIEQEPVGHDDVVWADRPLGELIDHIVERYHQPLRPELRRLVAMASKVEAVHKDKASCPFGLAEHLVNVTEDLEEHMGKEEAILFPMIRSKVIHRGPCAVLTGEHLEHANALARTRKLTGDLQPPPEACTTWRALYLGLQELERELMDHIHLENNVLFKRALAAQ